jgi:hypothetical protein
MYVRAVRRLQVAVAIIAVCLPVQAATAAGVGAACGGFMGLPCDAGSFCQFDTGKCGQFDLMGKCVQVPQACDRISRPVCGCDGKTYGNDCVRLQARVSKASNGQCRLR